MGSSDADVCVRCSSFSSFISRGSDRVRRRHISVLSWRVKAHGMVARFAAIIQVAIRGLEVVFQEIARVVFGAVFPGICPLRPERAVKRVAVQIDGVHTQTECARAAAHAALFCKWHIVRFVNGGALAFSEQRSLGRAARGVQAAARKPGLRTVALVGGPVWHVVGPNVLNARHRIGGQLLLVALAPRLQICPRVAVIRFAHERHRRFNDVVRRAHANVFRVVQPRLDLITVGVLRIAHLHEALVFHALARFARLRRNFQQLLIKFGIRIGLRVATVTRRAIARFRGATWCVNDERHGVHAAPAVGGGLQLPAPVFHGARFHCGAAEVVRGIIARGAGR